MLTGLYSYGRYAVVERRGVAGYGVGTLTLTPAGMAAIETNLGLAMAAVGQHAATPRPALGPISAPGWPGATRSTGSRSNSTRAAC